MRLQFFGPLTSALPCSQGQIDLIKPYFPAYIRADQKLLSSRYQPK